MAKVPVYNPLLSVRANAKAMGISQNTLRKRLKRANQSPALNNYESRLYRVQEAMKRLERIGVRQSINNLTKECGYSRQTVIKYKRIIEEGSLKTTTENVSHFRPNLRSAILTVSDCQTEILNSILKLYVRLDRFHADLTYSQGSFWKHLKKPELKFDKFPQTEQVRPLSDAQNHFGQLTSCVVDLPFILRQGKSDTSIIANRFTAYQSVDELFKSYKEMIELSHNLLQSEGILIVKCQNTSYCNRQIWVHPFVIQTALSTGYELLDEFVLLNPKPIISLPVVKTNKARKAHSYFLVFKKY